MGLYGPSLGLYGPSLIAAGLVIAAVLLVRRGSAVVRVAVAVIAVLPAHTALLAMQPLRGCLVQLGSGDDCIREINRPEDLLRAHALLAAFAVVALVAYFVARRMPRRRTRSRDT